MDVLDLFFLLGLAHNMCVFDIYGGHFLHFLPPKGEHDMGWC